MIDTVFIQIWFTCPEIFLQPLMIKIKRTSWFCWLSLEVIFLSIFFFLFIVWLPSVDQSHYCIQPLFHSHCLPDLVSFSMLLVSFGLFLYRFKQLIGNNLVPSKYEFSITSYISLQNGCFYWKCFQFLTSLFLDIPNYFSLISL